MAKTVAAPRNKGWSEWDRFVADHPDGGFMQSSSWIRCRERDGYRHMAIVLRDEQGRIVGGAVVGRWDVGDDDAFYYVQEGPLLPEEPELAQAVMGGLMQRLEQHRRADEATVSHLRIEPRRTDWPRGLAGRFGPPGCHDRFREPRHTLCVDLRAGEDERLAGMKPKGRYNVRLARRHGVCVVEDNTARGFDDFLAIRGDTARRQGLSEKSRSYLGDIVRGFRSRAHLFFAELDGRRLASALVLRFGRRATYFFGGSLDERREAMAPYLLHHDIMNRMAARGCTAYDFWGVAPPGQADHAWAGISEFKRKFGGIELSLVPVLDHVYDRRAYGRYIRSEGEPERSGTARHTTHPSETADHDQDGDA